jgi:hypothetical protein
MNPLGVVVHKTCARFSENQFCAFGEHVAFYCINHLQLDAGFIFASIETQYLAILSHHMESK